jgi:hypothetical protein
MLSVIYEIRIVAVNDNQKPRLGKSILQLFFNFYTDTLCYGCYSGSSGYLGIRLVGTSSCGVHGSGGVYVGSLVEG